MEERKEELVVETTNINEEPKNEAVSTPDVKKNPAKKNTFLSYLYGIWYNFIDSFRYNPCKLAGILIALPGLFIGFFLGFHSNVIFLVNNVKNEADLSGLLMFILVLMGCINIFNGVTVSSKRNLGSVIVSTICSAVIIVCGIFWIQKIFYSNYLCTIPVEQGGHDLTNGYQFTTSTIMSIASVILSMACSLAGCILGFIKYNRNYKKVKF
ncbi:MAG: hypothetical protein K2O23_03070 [Anaeroplasmataceae bacterium]|nr:hypothetical protein [Anaeroplasmataceae bacterium]